MQRGDRSTLAAVLGLGALLSDIAAFGGGASTTLSVPPARTLERKQ